jgi:hypothetical protein
MKAISLVLSTIVVVLLPATGHASTVTVGDIQFVSEFVGVNDFTVDNYTGSNNLGFFSVENDLVFTNVVITATESGGGVLSFTPADIGPGTDTSSQVADTLLFTQVVFSAILSPSTFNLTNGSSGTFVANPALTFTLLPSSGPYLVAGIDGSTFDADPSPEPSTLLLFGLGLLVVWTAKTAKRSRAVSL